MSNSGSRSPSSFAKTAVLRISRSSCSIRQAIFVWQAGRVRRACRTFSCGLRQSRDKLGPRIALHAMRVAIMQPYFFPYIGYFQLIHSVDLFIIYDNIKYTKKGWINRNRFLRNGAEVVFTVPLRKDSDFLNVKDRTVAGDFGRGKLVNQLREAYRRAPHFDHAFPVVERSV